MIKIYAEQFGKTESGKSVTRFVMENKNGLKVAVIDYGCAVQSILVPDKDGAFRGVALGYDIADYYMKGCCCKEPNIRNHHDFVDHRTRRSTIHR